MTDSLGVLLRSLQLAGLDIDAEAALDSLWLGREMRAKERVGVAPPDSRSADAIVPGDTTRPTPPIGDAEKRPSSERKRRDSLSWRTAEFAVPAAATRVDAPAQARTVTLARAAALPASRELMKALRPLRRRVVSPGAGVLDVDATVRRAAEEDLWFPSFASARERWLDVLLVADHGMSMILWKDTIDEFERLLRNSGAFRSVRSWWLESDADTLAVAARGRGASPATPEGLARLTRGAGRSVVLVVSDCVGARWHDGAIPRLVGAWSSVLPVALMQVTPEWFWARTALGDTVGSRFRSAVPAAVNHRFRWDASALGVSGGGLSTEEEKTLLRVPATTLTADAVARLAGLIAGVGREWAPGVVFDLTWEQQDDETAQALPVSARERVARFRALASNAAQRLAAGFAASPVRTLGVLRLLRRDLLPDASPFAEAEVMLGGIVRVKREEARWDLGASLPLEFIPGVQELLLDGAVAGDVLRVLTHAAAVAQTGVGPTFTSWLENPSSGAAQLDPAESAFAAAAAQVLGRLGGAYAQIVKPEPSASHEGMSGSVAQQQSVPAEVIEDEPTDAFPGFVGTPHQLPCPQVLHGRREQLFQVNRWVNEVTPRQVLAVDGLEGIGKSALAGQTVFNWREHWPDDEPFVWCFHRDPTSGEMFRLLRNHYAGARADDGSGTKREVLDAMFGRARSLVVFDGVDAIGDQGELNEVLDTAASIAEIGGARVLVTSRETCGERLRAEQLTLGGLDRADVDALVLDLRPASAEQEQIDASIMQFMRRNHNVLIGERTAEEIKTGLGLTAPAGDEREMDVKGRELTSSTPKTVRVRSSELRGAIQEISSGREKEFLRRIAQELGGGNPLVIKTLVARSAALSAKAMLEELDRDAGDRREIAPDQLPQIEAQLDQAARARDLSAMGELLVQAGNMREAFKAFNDAVALRSELPSKRLRAGALFDRGRVSLALAYYDRASADLADAAGLYRMLSAHRELVPALEALAEARTVTGRVDEATSLVHEALDLARGDGDEAGAVRLRRQLESLESLAAQPAEGESNTPPPDVLQGDDRVLSVEFLVSGRVQGVGFRVFVQQCAREIGLERGEAENLADGRIRVRATGPRPRLKQLEERLRRGPPSANVVHVEITILEDFASAHENAETSDVRGSTTAASGGLVRAVIAIGIGRPSPDLPELHAATDAARRVAEWAISSQHIPRDMVTLLTDEMSPVTGGRISKAVESTVGFGSIDQLIIFFAGYSANVRHGEYWLLSQALNDPTASVSVEDSTQLARSSGIPHVVFVSDTCHVSPISAQAAAGRAIFPSVATKTSGSVDQFFATRWEPPAEERPLIKNVADASRHYHAMFTTVLLAALGGEETSIQDEREGVMFVRPRALASYLRTAVPKRMFALAVSAQQQPEARIESNADAWLARFEPTPAPWQR